MSTSRFLREAPFDHALRAGAKKICRWCGGPVPGRRQCWCSQACVDQYLDRVDGQRIRRRVFERDRGVCALCGVDTEAASRQLTALYQTRDLMGFEALVRQLGAARKGRRNARLWPRGHLWEADHIVPVVEGGGGCGLENLRTLCLRCHKRETAALAARRAKARQAARQPEPSLFGGAHA